MLVFQSCSAQIHTKPRNVTTRENQKESLSCPPCPAAILTSGPRPPGCHSPFRGVISIGLLPDCTHLLSCRWSCRHSSAGDAHPSQTHAQRRDASRSQPQACQQRASCSIALEPCSVAPLICCSNSASLEQDSLGLCLGAFFPFGRDCYPHSLRTTWPSTTVMTAPISFSK